MVINAREVIPRLPDDTQPGMAHVDPHGVVRWESYLSPGRMVSCFLGRSYLVLALIGSDVEWLRGGGRSIVVVAHHGLILITDRT